MWSFKVDEAEKKNDNEPSDKLIDMENVDTTKLNGGRLFDQAFVSPNEEVQVKFLIDILDLNLVHLFLLQFMTFILWALWQNKALRKFYESAGLSAEKKLEVKGD